MWLFNRIFRQEILRLSMMLIKGFYSKFIHCFLVTSKTLKQHCLEDDG